MTSMAFANDKDLKESSVRTHDLKKFQKREAKRERAEPSHHPSAGEQFRLSLPPKSLTTVINEISEKDSESYKRKLAISYCMGNTKTVPSADPSPEEGKSVVDVEKSDGDVVEVAAQRPAEVTGSGKKSDRKVKNENVSVNESRRAKAYNFFDHLTAYNISAVDLASNPRNVDENSDNVTGINVAHLAAIEVVEIGAVPDEDTPTVPTGEEVQSETSATGQAADAAVPMDEGNDLESVPGKTEGEKHVEERKGYECVLLPDTTPLGVAQARVTQSITGPRPYAVVDLFGLKEVDLLIDTGAAANLLNGLLFAELNEKMGQLGKAIALIPSETVLNTYGGNVLGNSGYALLHFTIGNNTFTNIPFMIVDGPSANNEGILGTQFIKAVKLDLIWDEGDIIMHFGAVPEMTDVVAILKGKKSYQTAAIKDTELLPKETKKIQLHFEAAPGLCTNLDDSALLLTVNKDLEGILDLDQITYCKKGEISAMVTNIADYPFSILPQTIVGQAEPLEHSDSIDLAAMEAYTETIQESKDRIVTCLCPEVLGETYLLIPLNSGGYSLLGTPNERESPFDKLLWKDKGNLTGARIQGNKLWIWPNKEGYYNPLSDAHIRAIKQKIPCPGYRILFPYILSHFVNPANLQTVLELRAVGYSVDVAAFLPFSAENPCEDCCRWLLEGALDVRMTYKIKELAIVTPNKFAWIPCQYQSLMPGTEVREWRVWDWHVSYYKANPNTMVFVPHIPPPHLNNENAIEHYFTCIMAYLKPLFPHAQVKVVTIAKEFDKILYNEGLLKAWSNAADLNDYMDGMLGKPRHKPDGGIQYEMPNVKLTNCSCQLCNPEGGLRHLEEAKDDLTIQDRYLIDNPWPIREDLAERLKQIKLENDAENAAMCSTNVDAPVAAVTILPRRKEPRVARDFVENYSDIMTIAAVQARDIVQELIQIDEVRCDRVVDEGVELVIMDEPAVEDAKYGVPNCSKEYVPDFRPHIDLSHLKPAQQKVIYDLLQEFESLFSVNKDDMRLIKQHTVSFDVKNEEPFYENPFPMAMSLQTEYITQMETMVRKGLIVPDTNRAEKTLFYSNSFLVPKNSDSKLKQEKKYRLVHNLVKLNTRITSSHDGYRIKATEEMFASFIGATATSIFDSVQYFNSHVVKNSCRKYLGLSSYGRKQYVLVVLPLGISSGPGITGRCGDTAFTEDVLLHVTTFVDDNSVSTYTKAEGRPQFPLDQIYLIILGSEDGLDYEFLEHTSLLRKFFGQSDNHGLLFSIAKAQFLPQKFRYLGYDVEQGKMSIPPIRFLYLDQFDFVNCTQKDVQTLLGTMNFVSSSVDSFAAKAAILYAKATQKKGQRFKLTDIEIKMARELIADIKDAPNRFIWNPALQTEIFCDASSYAMGAIVTQILGNRRVFVRALSWKFSKVDVRRLNSLEKEAAVVIKVIRQCPQYFCTNITTVIYSDMMSVCMMLKNYNSISPNSRLDRWLLTLASIPLNFVVQWISSADGCLQIADTLSRDPRYLRYYTRFSNRLEHLKKSDIPEKVWKPQQVVSTQEIRDFMKNADLYDWPKTDRDHVLAQDREDDPFNDLGEFERQCVQYFLPKISYNTSRLVPTIPKKTRSIRTESMASQDEADPPFPEEDDVNDFKGEEVLTSEQLCGNDPLLQLAGASVCALNGLPTELQLVQDHIQSKKGNPFTTEDIIQHQMEDPKTNKIVQALKMGNANVHITENYALFKDHVLCKKHKDGYRIVLPFPAILIVAAFQHLFTHSGADSMNRILRLYYSAQDLTSICEAVALSCKACMFNRINTRPDSLPGIAYRPSEPWTYLIIDHVSMESFREGRKTYSHILQILDPCSKLSLAQKTVSTKAEETALILDNLLSTLPTVKTICSDAHKGLVSSNAVKAVLDKHGVKRRIPMSNHGPSHALVENQNKLMKELLLINCRYYKTKNWISVFHHMLRQCNTLVRSYHAVKDGKIKEIHTTPMMIAYAEPIRIGLDDLLGNPKVDLDVRRKWKKEILHVIGLANTSKEEAQKEADEEFKDSERVHVDNFVILRDFSRYPKREHKYTNNVYKVVARHNRMLTCIPIFGKASRGKRLVKVHITNAKLFKESELMKHLPKNLQLALGTGVDLDVDPGKKMPFPLESEYNADATKKRNATFTVTTRDSDTESETSSDDEEDAEEAPDPDRLGLALPKAAYQQQQGRAPQLENVCRQPDPAPRPQGAIPKIRNVPEDLGLPKAPSITSSYRLKFRGKIGWKMQRKVDKAKAINKIRRK